MKQFVRHRNKITPYNRKKLVGDCRYTKNEKTDNGPASSIVYETNVLGIIVYKSEIGFSKFSISHWQLGILEFS